MDSALLVLYIVLAVVIVRTSIVTIMGTRRRYYHEYLKRKGRS